MAKLDSDKARGRRITLGREYRDFTQDELAHRLAEKKGSAISRGAVGNWERGFGLTTENLDILAKVLGVSPEWLLTGSGRGPESIEHVGNTPDLPEIAIDHTTVQIPEYDVRAGMGDGFIVDREAVKDFWTFSRRYLADELRLNPRSLAMLEVVGDSMEPTLKSGDRVLIDMTDRRIGTPGIFILWDGDGTVAKRLDLIPGSNPRRILRISDNPLHPPREVLVEDTNIVGRVVWFARRL